MLILFRHACKLLAETFELLHNDFRLQIKHSVDGSMSGEIFGHTLTELSVKSFKEGRNCGFDPSLKRLSMKSSLFVVYISKSILNVG
jgi:hypothetical protein